MEEIFQKVLTEELKQEITQFAQDLIKIKSYSGQEKEAIQFVEQRMITLGYDEVKIDSMGNLLGTVGKGDRILMFDSHVDTVEVPDEDEWKIPPFTGKIIEGVLHGRGSVDMKSAVAASVYAGAIAQKLGILKRKKVLVSCTVFEEYCDGVNLDNLFDEFNISPDYVVICEPSNNNIMLGHQGKAQILIMTTGSSAHAAEPQKGQNAIYEMAEIIQRVESLNKQLSLSKKETGSIIISNISSKSASLNAVPTECRIYIDRRLSIQESLSQVKAEMDTIVKGKNATWTIGTLHQECWTGKKIRYEPFHEPWKTAKNHELTKACIKAYKASYGKDPDVFGFWNFSTNAVTPVKRNIPCIGFGPGDYKLAHMRDERIPINAILDACCFYTNLIYNI